MRITHSSIRGEISDIHPTLHPNDFPPCEHLLAFVPAPQFSRSVGNTGASSTSGTVSNHGNGCPCGSCSLDRHGAACKCGTCSRSAHSVGALRLLSTIEACMDNLTLISLFLFSDAMRLPQLCRISLVDMQLCLVL